MPATVVETCGIHRATMSETAPPPSDVASVILWMERTPLSPAANLNQTSVPITGVAGIIWPTTFSSVAVRDPVPSLFVYVTVAVLFTAALVFAVVVNRPIISPSPFVVPFTSRAGNVTELIVCAVVVVTTIPLFTHRQSKKMCGWTTEDQTPRPVR
jgi:hypothetical protein